MLVQGGRTGSASLLWLLANTMKLIRAEFEGDWELAKEVLLQVIENLDRNKKSLWTVQQADIVELKRHYRLEELYFLRSENEIYGMVFIQHKDVLFWPEIETEDSYFVHKLAVLPQYKGQDYGYKILDFILEIARINKINYVRLDCDPRPELISFYENYGFSFVSNIWVGVHPVAKFELLIK